MLHIGEHELIVELVALDLKGYDVIFGMNLLSTFRVVMDCFRKRITFQLPRGVVFSFVNDRSCFHPFPTMGSRFLKAKARSHLSFLASLMGDERDKFPTKVVLIDQIFQMSSQMNYQGYPHKERLSSRLISIREPNPYPLLPTVWHLWN